MPKIKFPPKLSDCHFLIEKLIRRGGVIIPNPENVWISPEIFIGAGTIIYPNCYLWGDADSSVGEDCEIGPSAFLRGRFKIGKRVKIGFNAEIVRSKIDDETKVPHFSHVGDALIGKGSNIAAGVIFCNYDGKYKHQTIINDNAFIGSGVMLIPSKEDTPLVIGKGAFIAAGAIITKEVKEYSVVMGVNTVVKGKACLVDEIGWEIISKNDHPILRAQPEEPDQGYP